jgi:hypothetical protein
MDTPRRRPILIELAMAAKLGPPPAEFFHSSPPRPYFATGGAAMNNDTRRTDVDRETTDDT